MSMDVGQILDGLILILLCVTIFYAARLSMFMNNFRDARAEFDTLIENLSRNIQRAEQAIATMRTMASTSGTDLQAIVNDSKFMADELRFMNDAGDNLAGRLEKLAERNRELVDLLENAGGIGPSSGPVTPSSFTNRPRPASAPEPVAEEKRPPAKPAKEKEKTPFFRIKDREFERPDADDAIPASVMPAQSAPAGQSFQSQAEKDLYEALQKGKNKSRAGGVV